MKEVTYNRYITLEIKNIYVLIIILFIYFFFLGDFMQKTDWHKICVFKPNLRDAVYNYLRKGQRVMINGRISYSEFKDEEGNSRPSTAIIADDVIFFQ